MCKCLISTVFFSLFLISSQSYSAEVICESRTGIAWSWGYFLLDHNNSLKNSPGSIEPGESRPIENWVNSELAKKGMLTGYLYCCYTLGEPERALLG